jgi:threonine dehydrogenase-like Zn-dependent dehydrogenase
VLRVRACGICGTDMSCLHMAGMPLRPGGQITVDNDPIVVATRGR